MTFEQDLIRRHLPHLAARSQGQGTPESETDVALLCAATAAVVRMDERLRAASPAVRTGWRARALLHEASASARLDEAFTEAHDLLLMDHHALDRLVDHDSQRAYQGLQMLRAVSRRHPRQLFTPRRLLAAARVRFRDRTDAPGYPEWLQERRADPSEILDVLARALEPAALAALRAEPALKGALAFLALWHRSGAADVLGGAPGRALATAWLRRVGLIGDMSFLPAIGFIGYANDYQPGDRRRWPGNFLEAVLRAADWQLSLLERLVRAEQRFSEWAKPLRATSNIARLAEFVISSAAVSPRAAAEALHLSHATVRRLVGELERKKLVREITGRDAFRLFAEA